VVRQNEEVRAKEQEFDTDRQSVVRQNDEGRAKEQELNTDRRSVIRQTTISVKHLLFRCKKIDE